MQKDNDSSHRRIITSVEVVDVPPIEPEDYVTITGSHHNKRWLSACHPRLGRDGRRFHLDKYF